eukprot:CAMPEP_0196666624 /NCGR_PEP_ID=MMETSP1086-20130531/64621_1 /TAXON_ID=77921 /ORGANISM="Cyanoptyche  gloeocystis , Strain SAG4.97" /LENGTH=134 /DNA_ID=CAMNT_0042003843 /DNA_START=584 /DNA_END=989 /DNA_ORIENTATION=+
MTPGRISTRMLIMAGSVFTEPSAATMQGYGGGGAIQLPSFLIMENGLKRRKAKILWRRLLESSASVRSATRDPVEMIRERIFQSHKGKEALYPNRTRRSLRALCPPLSKPRGNPKLPAQGDLFASILAPPYVCY